MDDETDSYPSIRTQNELMRDLLRQVDERWRADQKVTDDRLQSLSALIGTYDPGSMDETFRRGFADLYALGQDIAELRNTLAAEAGIDKLAWLGRLASINGLLDRPDLKTVDITDLSDKEYLNLFLGD